LGPLASTHFYIEEYDRRGGAGANFVVKWRSAAEVNQPIIEGIMLGLASGQGLSFTCPGQILSNPGADTLLHSNDVLFVLGSSEKISEAITHFHLQRKGMKGHESLFYSGSYRWYSWPQTHMP
jgi:hypothetical protein